MRPLRRSFLPLRSSFQREPRQGNSNKDLRHNLMGPTPKGPTGRNKGNSMNRNRGRTGQEGEAGSSSLMLILLWLDVARNN